MREKVKWTKAEIFLVLLTVIFFAVMLALFLSDRAEQKGTGYTVSTRIAQELAPVENVLVDINTADRAELETLSGVGEVLSQRIIDYRTEHGPFASVEDLAKVSGIGEKILQDNRERLSIGEDVR